MVTNISRMLPCNIHRAWQYTFQRFIVKHVQSIVYNNPTLVTMALMYCVGVIILDNEEHTPVILGLVRQGAGLQHVHRIVLVI